LSYYTLLSLLLLLTIMSCAKLRITLRYARALHIIIIITDALTCERGRYATACSAMAVIHAHIIIHTAIIHRDMPHYAFTSLLARHHFTLITTLLLSRQLHTHTLLFISSPRHIDIHYRHHFRTAIIKF
jgi:hypothetical protein